MAKKIRLITFHTPKNYGAILQAYSLLSFLKTLSSDVKIIDFNTAHLRSLYLLHFNYNSLKGKIKSGLDSLYIPQKKSKFQKFDRFVDKYLDLTERYESFDELRASPPSADFYITGSDQVFGPNRIEEERNAFYLNFGSDKIKRVAYAASFGAKSVPKERSEEISAYLARFDHISVREKGGINIVQTLSGKEAVEVLDPVFLNDQLFWRGMAEFYPHTDEPYLLYYRILSSTKSDEIVCKLARKKKLRLMVITDGFLRWKADRVLRDVGLQEFLYLFDHAQFIATDSFHGVAFALIFEKQFYFCDFNKELAERALNLLQIAGAEKAAALNSGDNACYIDYSLINERLRAHIDASRDFLKDALH